MTGSFFTIGHWGIITLPLAGVIGVVKPGPPRPKKSPLQVVRRSKS
jgi:hypothetical protein